MNNRFLEAFVWVARLKSFRAAAEKLNVSQATISSRISTLERDFQCSLFDREHNGIALTMKGSLLLDKAQSVLTAELILKQALSRAIEPVGRIRIGVVESIVHTWLGLFLSQFTQAYPKVEIELTAEPTLHLHGLFAKGSLDIILQTDHVLDEAVLNTELSPLELGWVCRSDSTLANREVSLIEIAEHPVITFTRGSKPHLDVLSLFENAGLKPSQIHCVTSIAAITVLVRDGMGIATTPILGLKSGGGLEKDLVILKSTTTLAPLALVASWYKKSDDSICEDIVGLAKSISENYC